VSALRQIVEAADRSVAEHAVGEPGIGRFEREIADEDRGFVLEAVHEGFLLHYGRPRAFDGMDADLRLLAGDSLYALGLARLAATGDLEGVAELADLISLSARAEAEAAPELVEELWEASLEALARGGPGARAAVEPKLARGPA
jgi:hypothetical protein